MYEWLIWLEQMPLLWRPPDERLELVGEFLRDPGDVGAEPSVAGRVQGRMHEADVGRIRRRAARADPNPLSDTW